MVNWSDAKIQSFRDYSVATLIDLKVNTLFPDLAALSSCLIRFGHEDIAHNAYVMQYNQASQQLRLYIPRFDARIKKQLASATWIKLSAPYFFGPEFSARGEGVNIVMCDEAGMGSAIFLAQYYKKKNVSKNLYLFFESKEKFSFNPVPSQFMTPFLPAHVIAAMPLLEDWGILSRLLNPRLPGCFDESINLLLSMVVDYVCWRHEQKVRIELIGHTEFLSSIHFTASTDQVNLLRTWLVP